MSIPKASGCAIKYTSLNSTWFAPDVSGTLLAEDQDGTWSDYVWLNGKLVAMIRNGNVYSVHTDQTGRPEGMTNSQGTVIWRAKNFAFDREVTAGQASGFNLGFPGQYFDEEGGLYYNGARDYSPGLGRYIESDPIGLAGGINTYVYAENNPISTIDPSGLVGYICQSGNNVSIVLPITFSGNYTPDQIAQMASGIENAWSGQIGGYNVTTTVVDGSSLNIPVNTIQVVQGSGLSRTFNSTSGIWFASPYYIHGLDYAHEAGHLLGL